MAWLGRWTCDHKVVGSTPGRVAIKWLLLGWVTVCGQAISSHGRPTNTKVNSDFHAFEYQPPWLGRVHMCRVAGNTGIIMAFPYSRRRSIALRRVTIKSLSFYPLTNEADAKAYV